MVGVGKDWCLKARAPWARPPPRALDWWPPPCKPLSWSRQRVSGARGAISPGWPLSLAGVSLPAPHGRVAEE